MASSSSIHIILVAAGYCVIGLAFIFACVAIFIIIDEWAKVKHTPRVPMSLCDKHGAYPSSESLRDLVPIVDEDGSEKSTNLEMCPFCLKERMAAAKETLKI